MSGIPPIPPIAIMIPIEQVATPPLESPVDPPTGDETLDSTPSIPPIHLDSRLLPPFSSSIFIPPKVPRRRYQVLSMDPLASREIKKASSGSGDRYKGNLSSSSTSVPFPESNPSPLTSPALKVGLLFQESSSSGSGNRYKGNLSSSSTSVPFPESSPSPLTSPALKIGLLFQESPSSKSGDQYQSDSSLLPSAIARRKPSPLPKIPTLNLGLLPLLPDSVKPEPTQPNTKHTPIRETPGDISSRYCPPDPHSVDGSLSVRFVVDQSPAHGKIKASPAPYLFMRYAKRANTPTILQHNSSNSSSTLSPRPFEGTFSEVHLITDMKKKFSEDTAAKTIAAYLTPEENREENIKSVLAVLLPYHKMQKTKRIEQRWNLLLTAILLRLECVDLIYAFLQQTEIKYLHFGTIVTNGFRCKKTPHKEIVHIISLYTQKDLEKEKPDDTLFRTDTPSSSLLSRYGHYLLTDFLAQLEKTIVRHWRTKAPPLLYLNHQKIHQSLSKSWRGFIDLSIQQQNKLCEQVMQRNKEPCKEFLEDFLKHFYKQPLPAACQNLLETRHDQIYHFIKEKTVLSLEQALDQKIALSAEQIHELSQKGKTTLSSEQAQRKSEERIGADLFLRIINPYLTMISNEPSEQNCLTSLSRIMQTISNQILPELPKLKEIPKQKEKEKEEEEKINLFAEDILFHELYTAFENTHQKYMRENFPIKLPSFGCEDDVQNI